MPSLKTTAHSQGQSISAPLQPPDSAWILPFFWRLHGTGPHAVHSLSLDSSARSINLSAPAQRTITPSPFQFGLSASTMISAPTRSLFLCIPDGDERYLHRLHALTTTSQPFPFLLIRIPPCQSLYQSYIVTALSTLQIFFFSLSPPPPLPPVTFLFLFWAIPLTYFPFVSGWPRSLGRHICLTLKRLRRGTDGDRDLRKKGQGGQFLTPHCHNQNNFCLPPPKKKEEEEMGSDDRHILMSLTVTVWGLVTRQCPQTTTFSRERSSSRSGELNWNRPSASQPNQRFTARPNRLEVQPHWWLPLSWNYLTSHSQTNLCITVPLA